MEIQQSVLKLLAKVESMETNIETKLESVKDKISNLDEKVSTRIDFIEKQIEEHIEADSDIKPTLETHHTSIEKAKTYIERIHSLEEKYIVLDKKYNFLFEKIKEHELEPTKKKAGIIDGLSTAVKNAVFIAVGAGVVGILGMILLQYIKSL